MESIVVRSHIIYKYDHGKPRNYTSIKYFAWILGVKKKFNFNFFLTGGMDKSKSAFHHTRSWNSEPERYDISIVSLISIHHEFQAQYALGNNYLETI